MTTELEITLLDTFGIKPKSNKCELAYCAKNVTYNCKNCEHFKPKYPQITDKQYLELICILNPYSYPSGKNIQHLKEGVLEWCIKFKNDIKHQVQAIFEGER